MSNPDSDTTVRRNREHGQVTFTNQQTQTFEEENFVHVYNDTLQNLDNLENQLKQYEDKRETIIEENSDELAALNYVLGNDTPETFDDIDTLRENITEEVFEKHNELQQLKQQITQLETQKDRLEEQLDSMRPVAEDIAETHEDLNVNERVVEDDE